jgi:CheY-like chemotaxis protein/anti-sigma regulatory factor (Ser/Thr protein kinase)
MANVLVVDDSAVDRLMAGRLLEKNSDLKVSYANDGSEALALFSTAQPDIVVTDLQMPVMNGLALVETIRDKHPLVPVILMTAHGSEEVAVQALLSGAASYVPKSELPKHLLDTVQNVLAAARSTQQHQRLMQCLQRRDLNYVLDNDSSLIPPLVDQVQQVLSGMGLVDDAARIQTAIALEEAILNALYHGNLELSDEELEELRASLLQPDVANSVTQRWQQPPYRDRKIYVNASISRDEARFTVRDEGPGFDPSTLPDPTDPAALTRESGRGLVLMKMFMDDVIRNQAGNEVVLVKRRVAKSNGSPHA